MTILLPSSLVLPVGRTGLISYCAPVSPAQSWAVLFHSPTHRLLCNRLPGTHPVPKRLVPLSHKGARSSLHATGGELWALSRSRVASVWAAVSHPPTQPRCFHPPTHRLLCNRSPGTRLVTRCPQLDTMPFDPFTARCGWRRSLARASLHRAGCEHELGSTTGPAATLPSSLVSSAHEVDSALPATCEGGSALSLRSPFGDGETHCAKVRSDAVWNGPSCGAK